MADLSDGTIKLISEQSQRQRESIDRLMAHLRVHCPELSGEGDGICKYQEDIRNAKPDES